MKINSIFYFLIGVNLLEACFGKASEIFVQNLSEMREKVSENLTSEIKRPKFFCIPKNNVTW